MKTCQTPCQMSQILKAAMPYGADEQRALHVLPLPWLLCGGEPSPECSPSSCLACSDGIPGSVPSDCRLAPLPPISHTYTQTGPIICSPLIFISPMWGSEAFACPTAARVALIVHLAHVDSPLPLHLHSILNQFYTCFYYTVLGLSPARACFFCRSFVSRVSVWF